MPSLSQYNFQSSKLNLAADEIIARLKLMPDASGQLVFQDRVTRGAILPIDATITKQESPFVRVWYDTQHYDIRSEDFVPWQGGATLVLYIGGYSYGENEEGSTTDLQQALADLSWNVINWLQDSSDMSVPFTHSTPRFWGFNRDQTVRQEFTNTYREWGGNSTMDFPYFFVKLSFDIDFYSYAG